MPKINDGGPAFPLMDAGESDRCPTLIDRGMSLRDYFAGQVLVGLSIRRAGPTDASDAMNAYSLADAMIAERQKARPEDRPEHTEEEKNGGDH